MKKSRIAKFALLGASTAALAATLTTSTYAWYVSNKEANVQKATANTGSAGADDSVLLSWSSNANFGKEINFTDSLNHPNIGNLHFMPVHEDATTADAFYVVASNGYGQASTAEETNNTKYLTFTLYAKTESTEGVDVQVAFTINNITTVSPALNQIAMVGTGQGSPVPQGSTFYYDCLDSMYVRQSYGTGASATTETISARSLGTSTLSGATAAGTANAHDYYKNVQGWGTLDTQTNQYTYDHTLWAESAPAVTQVSGTPITAFSNISLTQTPLAITYTIWLDGGDTDCFNSCAGWDITFSLTYTVVENNSNQNNG